MPLSDRLTQPSGRGRPISTAGLLLTMFALTSAAAAKDVDYSSEIKPLLARHCYDCHGEKRQRGRLRLDSAAAALEGGREGPAIVPGDPAASFLVRSLRGDDEIERMPKDRAPLSDAEIDLITRWVAEGAKAPEDEVAGLDFSSHWAFRPVSDPTPPELPGVEHPIDRFVDARLRAEGVEASPAAERATLARRAHLDLIGLTPQPEDLAAFVDDPEPEAWEKLVDRLLSSPAYGERQGRHWLDIARYADSHGFTIDGARSIWKYRDWVIGSLNDDLPYDEFVVEQVAGDLLPGDDIGRLVATGFHRNTLINQEGGTDQEQFRFEAVADRVHTTGAAFLGLTLECARCHDHKYDPISQAEYWQLFALLNNCDEPTIRVADAESSARLAAARAEARAAEEALAAHDRESAERVEALVAELDDVGDPQWSPLSIASFRSEEGAGHRRLEDGSVLVEEPIPSADVYTVIADLPEGRLGGIRLEALTHPSLPQGGPGLAGNGNFVLHEVRLELLREGAPPRPVDMASARADHSQDGWPVAAALDGDPQTGWAINVRGGSLNVPRHADLVLATPLRAALGDRIVVTLVHRHTAPRYAIGRLRIAATSAPPSALGLPEAARTLLAKPRAERTDADREALRDAVREADPRRASSVRRLEAARQAEKRAESAVPTSMVVRERASPRTTHIHIRGEYERPGEPVEPGTIAALHPLEARGESADRLDLARWLVDPRSPLAARVAANRLWQRSFGIGLVETENDFGTQGTPPTHPELLDWLAGELVRQGWSQKALRRAIVTSATYRRSSHARPDLAPQDPKNRLLARQRRLRAEAETIRDAALAASGLLSRRIGGPGVHPPQPDGVFDFTQNKKSWPTSEGADRFRRALYTFFWRSSPYPFLITFDAADGVVACTRRNRSNTPLQALTLSNDAAFLEIARGLAGRVLREAPPRTDARLRHAFLLCVAREPSAGELSTLERYLESETRAFALDAEAATRHAPFDAPEGVTDGRGAAWTAVARVLLNLDEFITRE